MAIEAKLREAMKAGMPEPLTTRDLTAAARRCARRREWFAGPQLRLYANQGGVYDAILSYLDLKR